ncbi:MAG: hypothetical protein GQ540_12605 [Lutibacter sp.]|uniref:DUF6146 family protein n=1 Tax=Lutibacter sp. TaxID=1925666 RepID=UPI0019DAE234|nr:DUF6146 family protein [Lutibacter sp.]NOR29358.1 hypothetical protein [Lutibacter sp.]
MRNLILFTVILALIFSCSSTSKRSTTTKETLQNEAVRIANDSLDYEIIIIDTGFEFYLNSIAKPANFYSQSYYETKNKFYVTTWNSRAQNPLRYNNDIYENVIDYNFNTNYGLDVNYKLYNYFKFVEYTYKEVF